LRGEKKGFAKKSKEGGIGEEVGVSGGLHRSPLGGGFGDKRRIGGGEKLKFSEIK